MELATQPPVVLRSMEIVGTPNDAHGIQFSDGDTVTTPSTFATPPCAVSVGRASNNRVCWFDGSPSPTSDVESVTNSRVAFPALNIVWTKEREGVEQNDETQLSAVQNVYKYMHTQASDHLSCDGGDTNAWLTRASVAKLILFLQQQGCLCRESVFLDGGCSYNVLASHVAQVVGCKVWGVEYVTTRCFMAATNMLRALKDPHNVGALVNPKIALVPSDLLAMTSFEPSTLGYFFDEAFNLDLIQHICDVAAASPSMKWILSFKASKWPSVSKLFESAGFQKLPTSLSVAKHGSGEGNTVYIYRRLESFRRDAPVAPTTACEYSKYLDMAWSDEAGPREAAYEHILHHSEAKLSVRRRRGVLDRRESYHIGRLPPPDAKSPPKVLFLGMVSPPCHATTLADVEALVLSGLLTPREGRDKARCMLVESHFGVDVYTLSNDLKDYSGSGRHIATDLRSPRCVRAIRAVVPGARFTQIALDYFWMPVSYVRDRFGRYFFGAQLKDLAIHFLVPGGLVFLPYHADVLSCLAQEEDYWGAHYDVRFLAETETEALAKHYLLVVGNNLPANTMQNVFQKSPSQARMYSYESGLSSKTFPGSLIKRLLVAAEMCGDTYCSIALERK